MIKGDKEYLEDIIMRYRCPEHDNPLEIAWHFQDNCYAIRCGAGHYPEEVTRQPSLTELYKQGVELPEPIKSNIEKGIKTRAMQQGKQSTPVPFYGIPDKDLATGDLLGPDIVKALVDYANKYHLDAGRGHVVLMYSKPYITLDGYLYHARRSGKTYNLSSRPMTTEELEQYKIGVTDHGWLAKVELTEDGSEFNGVGVVTFDEMTAKSPRDNSKLRSPVVATHPWQLAQKRAEWQALRRAFPIGEAETNEED